MTLCDSNVFIELFSANRNTLYDMERIGSSNIVASPITLMELFVGASNKDELKKIKKDMRPFRTEYVDEEISRRAIELTERYAKSHGLDIPDALIAATGLTRDFELFTYNTKDFRFIDGIKLYEHSE